MRVPPGVVNWICSGPVGPSTTSGRTDGCESKGRGRTGEGLTNGSGRAEEVVSRGASRPEETAGDRVGCDAGTGCCKPRSWVRASREPDGEGAQGASHETKMAATAKMMAPTSSNAGRGSGAIAGLCLSARSRCCSAARSTRARSRRESSSEGASSDNGSPSRSHSRNSCSAPRPKPGSPTPGAVLRPAPVGPPLVRVVTDALSGFARSSLAVMSLSFDLRPLGASPFGPCTFTTSDPRTFGASERSPANVAPEPTRLAPSTGAI